jgi:hypothetical protein
LRATIVSGGVVCLAGSALLSAALPAFWRYDSQKGRLVGLAEAKEEARALVKVLVGRL